MPELVEIEAYRRLAEARALDRPIAGVVAPDPWWLKGGLAAPALHDALAGRSFTVARRTGKRLMLETGPPMSRQAKSRQQQSRQAKSKEQSQGPVLGLRFGMTGRLLVDGAAGIHSLQYASNRDVDAWDRLVVVFDDGGRLAVRDPRRLGGAELDPDEGRLGPDAASITPAVLARALAGSRTALKARLMDQSRVAGLGNLLVDEILYRAGLDPARAAGGLSPNESRRLGRWIVRTVAELSITEEGGGSHAGEFGPARRPGGTCPADGTPLVRRTIGGRTTFSCPKHQR